MEISTTGRSDLKKHFKRNAIPSEEHFAHLIDGMINQRDDGISKSGDGPLRLQTSNATQESDKPILKLYQDFKTNQADWAISLTEDSVSSSVSISPETNRPENNIVRHMGFDISDKQGHSRLHIAPLTGNIGVGTDRPRAALHIEDLSDSEAFALYIRRPGKDGSDPYLGIQIINHQRGEEFDSVLITSSAAIRFSNERNFSIDAKDNLSIETHEKIFIQGRKEFLVRSPNATIEASETLKFSAKVVDIEAKTTIAQDDWRDVKEASLSTPVGEHEAEFLGWWNGGGSRREPRYFRDSMGFVHLQGILEPRGFAAGARILRLPPGYRPGRIVNALVMLTGQLNPTSGTNLVHLTIALDGILSVDNNGLSGPIKLVLDGIMFRAEQ